MPAQPTSTGPSGPVDRSVGNSLDGTRSAKSGAESTSENRVNSMASFTRCCPDTIRANEFVHVATASASITSATRMNPAPRGVSCWREGPLHSLLPAIPVLDRR